VQIQGGNCGNLTLRTYESNFIHNNSVQLGKKLQMKAILSYIVLSQQCFEAYYIPLTVVKLLWDLRNIFKIIPLTLLVGSAPTFSPPVVGGWLWSHSVVEVKPKVSLCRKVLGEMPFCYLARISQWESTNSRKSHRYQKRQWNPRYISYTWWVKFWDEGNEHFTELWGKAGFS